MSAEEDKKPALKDEKVIGNGSFGVVFQATMAETGENVAVKKVLQDKRFKVAATPAPRQPASIFCARAASDTPTRTLDRFVHYPFLSI